MLEQIPIFAGLPKEHLFQLKTISRKIFAEKRSILFSPGDALRASMQYWTGLFEFLGFPQRVKKFL